MPAEDLYRSTLFRGRRRYVEDTCTEWWILSAGYGLVHRAAVLSPYDVTLKNATRDQRRQWSAQVLAAVDHQIRPRPGDTFEIHAGAEYRDFGLVEGLMGRGCLVDNPTAGMGIGNQLQFYRQAGGR